MLHSSNKTTEFPQCWLPTILDDMFGPVSFLFRCSKLCREAGAWPCGSSKCDPSTLSRWTPSLPGSDYVKVEQALLSNIVGHSIYLIVPSNYIRGCRFENSEYMLEILLFFWRHQNSFGLIPIYATFRGSLTLPTTPAVNSSPGPISYFTRIAPSPQRHL